MSTAEFTLLLTENADFLKPFAINLTKDHESAKDLFQETSIAEKIKQGISLI